MAACPCGSTDLEPFADCPEGKVLRCRSCGMRFLAVLPDAAELERLYTAYGGYAEPERQSAALAAKRPAAQRLIKRMERQGLLGGRFLEVGCAAGAFLANIAELSRMECHGVEVDRASAAAAERLLPGRIRGGTLTEAAYPAGFFRMVYAEEVIEHVPDPAPLLDEICRVLGPGGRFFLSTPNFAGVGALVLGQRWKEFIPREHVRMYTPRALRRQLELHGFVDLKIRSFSVRLLGHDRRSRLPVPETSLAMRGVAKALGLAGLGEGIQAWARKG